MREVVITSRFKRDLKLVYKKGLDVEKLIKVTSVLCEQDSLEREYRQHKLKGEYGGYWECHLEPDWLVIYELTKDTVVFVRTGTHQDLFKRY